MDGLDRSFLIDRYAHTRAGARITSDKQASVQSVHERAARSRQREKEWGARRIGRNARGGPRWSEDESLRAEYVSSSAVAPIVAAMRWLR
jgi:hypothetical protein